MLRKFQSQPVPIEPALLHPYAADKWPDGWAGKLSAVEKRCLMSAPRNVPVSSSSAAAVWALVTLLDCGPGAG